MNCSVVPASSVTPKEWFEQCREPFEFYSEAERCNFGLPEHVFFNKRAGDRDIQYLFDAFTAGEFARIVSQTVPCKVSLVEGRFPDFSLAFDGPTMEIREYEAVEADKKGRRRAQEYRALYQRRMRFGPDYMELESYSPHEEEQWAREAIPRVVRQKADKCFPKATNLVVRNNLGALENAEYCYLTEPWRDKFNEIWVLKAPFAIRTWPRFLKLGDPNIWVPNT